MIRREFLRVSAVVAAATALDTLPALAADAQLDVEWYRRSRKFVELPYGRMAYVERGRGPAALFVHGYPLNGYQWRGALERLSDVRRCVAPDLMGLGYSEPKDGQAISPATQAEMLAALLDHLKIDSVDLVANDSGGVTAQMFVAKFPRRVRTLLLTNCDVDTNNPPPQFAPFVALAKKGTLVDRFVVSQLKDADLARSARGLGAAYSYPDKLADETIHYCLEPIASSPLRQRQFHEYTMALGESVLPPVREKLHAWPGAARMIWGMKDQLFPVEWAEWLDRTLPGSKGVHRVEDGNLFFPEEMPEVIAEQAKGLWLAKG